MRYATVYIFPLILVLTACAPTQFLKKNYPGTELEGQEILLYPVFPEQINILNMQDYWDDFEHAFGGPGEFMAGEINRRSNEFFGTKLAKVKAIAGEDTLFRPLETGNSIKVSEKIGQYGFEIRVPRRDHLAKHGSNPRFVLVMDQVLFSRNVQSIQHVNPLVNLNPAGIAGAPQPAFTNTTSKSLGVLINYAIYDYQDDSVVGYGQSKGKHSFAFVMTASDWYKAIDQALGNIKRYSPFK